MPHAIKGVYWHGPQNFSCSFGNLTGFGNRKAQECLIQKLENLLVAKVGKAMPTPLESMVSNKSYPPWPLEPNYEHMSFGSPLTLSPSILHFIA